jgi:hypothetical protein
MVKLKYKSLVTKETIDYYLSIIKDEKQKKNLLSTLSKFDIRIATEPVIKGEEFYYKIWILKRGTKKKAHIKEYYPLHILDKKDFLLSHLTLSKILDMIRLNAEVPDDVEEYCEIHFMDPSNEDYRNEYLIDLWRAERFKRFITQEEIRSFPFGIDRSNKQNNNNNEKEKIESIDLNDEFYLKLLGYSFIFLKDKKEYDKLTELQNTLEYYAKIVESYGYNPHTGDYDAKKFPIIKEDKQMENITYDFQNYFKALKKYYEYIKELINKYDVKPTGNLVKRLAFNINPNNTSNINNILNLLQQL